MDKLSEIEETKETIKSKKGFFASLKEIFSSVESIDTAERRVLFRDLLFFAVGFLLSRCHLIFGAYPLGIAFIAALPIGVWPSLMGTVIGSLSMGINGVIFAAVTAITAFLRAAVSIGEKNEDGRIAMFGEGLVLRMSISILCGFISAVYEVLLSGLNEASLLFGLCMVILPPIMTFVFSGLFSTGVDAQNLIFGSKEILSTEGKSERDKYELVFFQLSALVLIFFIGLSFKGVNALGISASYIFSSLVTLAVAKRFGGMRGMAVGFVSSLGTSGTLSVAFALAGLASGALFRLGAGYAIISGGVALCAFSAYSSGLTGLLGTLPEYIIASTLALPLLKRVERPEAAEETKTEEESSEDMVGTMALAYQNGYSGSVDAISDALAELAKVMKRHSKAPGTLSTEEYRDIIINVAERYCIGCKESGLCSREGIRPCIKKAEELAILLSEGKRINAKDVNTDTEFCTMAEVVSKEINREAARAEQENYLLQGKCVGAEEYELICRLLLDAKERDIREKEVDSSMTAPLTKVFRNCGFESGTIRVFGRRRRHFILAGEDSGGSRITSFELRKSIEEATGVKLAAPEYFRRGKMALMECGIRRKLSVSVAIAASAASDSEPSGDTALTFESSDDYFYSLISDGMGSGEIARETSQLVAEFIKSAVEIGAGKETVMYMLNRAVKSRTEECSATVDLFELDLLNGEAVFIKSGAAPSFIKRDSSIFRIRSHTAPIGLLSSIDTERIKAEIKPGDHIIMLSDGVADESEDAPWLLLLLGEPPKKDLTEYASLILNEAKKNRKTRDDMSVIVLRVNGI